MSELFGRFFFAYLLVASSVLSVVCIFVFQLSAFIEHAKPIFE